MPPIIQAGTVAYDMHEHRLRNGHNIGRVGQKGVVTKSVTNQEIERNAGVE